MAGSSDYPRIVDNPTQLQDGIDYMEADNINDAYVPINTIQTFVGANGKGASWSTDMLEFLMNAEAPILVKATASTMTVLAGAVGIKNAGQSNRLFRRSTGTQTITSANLDTGSMAIGFYDVFAIADSASTSFTVKFCVQGNTPSGATNYEKIGWFYNESAGSLDITNGMLGCIRSGNRNVPNMVQRSGTTDITTSSSTYVDMTDMDIRFVSSGRPVLITFDAYAEIVYGGFNSDLYFRITSDGNEVFQKYQYMSLQTSSIPQHTLSAQFLIDPLAAGTHQFKVQWRSISSYTMQQLASTRGSKRLFQAREI